MCLQPAETHPALGQGPRSGPRHALHAPLIPIGQHAAWSLHRAWESLAGEVARNLASWSFYFRKDRPRP